MKLMKNLIVIVVVIASVFLVRAALAVSDAAKIGANAGAMSYCKDEYAADDDKGKYNLLTIKTFGVFDELDSDSKVKAMVMKKAAEDGDYLGKPLTKDRCDSLRKTLYLKYRD